MATDTAETPIKTWPGYREILEHLNLCAEALDRQIADGMGWEDSLRPRGRRDRL